MNENQFGGNQYQQMNWQNGQNGCPGNGSMPPVRKKSGFGTGMLVGTLVGMTIVTFLLVLLLNVFYSTGFVHVGSNGEIYVQDTATSDDEGIGSAVEEKLNTLDSLLDSFYMEDVDEEAAADNIFKAYLDSYGDKYTVYYTPEEYQSILESTTGKFYGIGAVCQKNEDGTILITDAYDNAPAYAAGIRDGDCVVKVDGQDITDMDLSSAVALIKGDIGTTVHLEILREGNTFEVDVTRAEIKAQTVTYSMLDNHIGYLYISQFDTVTTEQFKAAVEDLQAQGMVGLIIDIRNNPGGVLGTVVDMLEYILPDGMIVYTEDKNGKRTEYKGSDGHVLEIPVAVLVNGNSASASEIFAGAVQDYGTGKIIGTQTFGKGIVQTIKPLTDGSAVKFTIAKYYTPKGQDIHGNGVTPDIKVDLTQEDTEDTQMKAAVEYLLNETKN